MAKNTKKVSLIAVVIHTFMVLITGGFWLIPLIIWWLLNNIKKN